MDLPKRFIHPILILVLTMLGISLFYYQSSTLSQQNEEVYALTNEAKTRLTHIAKVLNTLDEEDPAAVASVVDLLSEVVDDEDARTVLLQQRASSLLSAAALVVSIVLASINLVLKDAKDRLMPKDVYLLAYFVYLILLIFGASLYWTWVGFGSRPFASFNMDNLLENMAKDGADLHISYVVAVQQKYQMAKINRGLNLEKAEALRWATANLFLGLFLFSCFCLALLVRTSKASAYGEIENGKKK